MNRCFISASKCTQTIHELKPHPFMFLPKKKISAKLTESKTNNKIRKNKHAAKTDLQRSPETQSRNGKPNGLQKTFVMYIPNVQRCAPMRSDHVPTLEPWPSSGTRYRRRRLPHTPCGYRPFPSSNFGRSTPQHGRHGAHWASWTVMQC